MSGLGQCICPHKNFLFLDVCENEDLKSVEQNHITKYAVQSKDVALQH